MTPQHRRRSRLRSALAALATVSVVLGASACTSGGTPAPTPTVEPSPAPTAEPAADAVSLAVEVQGWNGWQEEQPSPQTTSRTIDDGATFEVQTVSGPVAFTVVEIADDRIDLETDAPLIATDGGGIDFDDATTTFTIDRPGPLTLMTPTLDGGTGITLTVDAPS